MYKVKIRPHSKAEMLHVLGNNAVKFKLKYKWLQDKWHNIASNGIGDCQELRLISPIIFATLTPVNASLIIDNVNYFKEHYKEEKEWEKTFFIACLCGSEEVASFLLDLLDRSKKKPDPGATLAYIAASQNGEWAQKMARELAEKGIKDILSGSGFYLFCDDIKTKTAVSQIFEDKAKKPKFTI